MNVRIRPTHFITDLFRNLIANCYFEEIPALAGMKYRIASQIFFSFE